MKGYKAFNKGLVCRGKQYSENTVFEEDTAKICESGMHFCKNPLAVLDYYPLVNEQGEMSEFAEVEALEEPVTENGEKYCTKKLKIGAKISFPALVQASVSFDLKKQEKKKFAIRTMRKLHQKATTQRLAHRATTQRLAHRATTHRLAHRATTHRLAHRATTQRLAHRATTHRLAHRAMTALFAVQVTAQKFEQRKALG